MKRVSLHYVIANKVYLTPTHIQNLQQLFYGYRDGRRKRELMQLTPKALVEKENYPRFHRLWFYEDGSVDYDTGQDWVTERRDLMQLLFP